MPNITGGMARLFNRKVKRVCPSCGLTIPVYPGRYPVVCPHCGADPEVTEKLDSILDLIISGSIKLEDICEEVDPKQRIGVDKIFQRVNIIDLLDQLVGVKMGNGSENIWLYFSEEPQHDKIRQLVDDIRPLCLAVDIYPSDEPDAKCVVAVQNPRSSAEPVVFGDIPTNASLQGEMEVAG